MAVADTAASWSDAHPLHASLRDPAALLLRLAKETRRRSDNIVHGELLRLHIEIGQLMVRHVREPYRVPPTLRMPMSRVGPHFVHISHTSHAVSSR